MKTQATKCNHKQLAYLAYWQQRGYKFGRDDLIPENPLIKPRQWYMAFWVDLAVTGLAMAIVFASLYFK